MQQTIIKRGNALLTKACHPVTDFAEARSIITNMMDTLMHIVQLYEFKRGHGIAAPQIGILKRINIVQYEGITKVLINPKMVSHSYVKMPIREGCLSFFDMRGTFLVISPSLFPLAMKMARNIVFLPKTILLCCCNMNLII